MKFRLIRWHRYLSLAVLAVWMLQAASGVILTFHRGVEDRIMGVSGKEADPEAIDRVFTRIKRDYGKPTEMFAGGDGPGRFDVLLEEKEGRQVRVWIDAADGRILGSDLWSGPFAEQRWLHLMFEFHNSFLNGKTGKKIVSVSGMLLVTNLLLALWMVWPRRGKWRELLIPKQGLKGTSAIFVWHRAIGLWFLPIGVILILAGSIMIWRGELESSLKIGPLPPTKSHFSTASIPPLPPSTAIAAATARYPGGKLAVLVLPSEAKPWFLIRLTRPEELRRTLGTTTVYVDALTGEIQSAWSPVDAPKLAYIIDSLYAVHTGEWGGFPSRLLVLATGVWIITMIILGVALWLDRQRKQRMRRDSTQ